MTSVPAFLLYHGTLASLVPSIMERGLEPRGDRPSHDEYMQKPSMPHLVYLTSSEGVAIDHACRISERKYGGAPVALLGIDMAALRKRLLYPDEDYLSEEWNSDFVYWTPEEQRKFIEYKRGTWRESLKTLKTVAYKGIVPAKAISVHTMKRWLEQEHRSRFRRIA